MAARGKKNSEYQGMNWCAPQTRLAIYLRDGMACGYCGAGIEDEIRLTLDHLTPHTYGGTNEVANLITCCAKCNSSRGARSWTEFAVAVGGYINHDITGADIINHIRACVSRELPRAEAKEMIARRGKLSAVLAEYR